MTTNPARRPRRDDEDWAKLDKKILGVIDQPTQRPGDVAYPEDGDPVVPPSMCWRCTALPVETEVGLCRCCDADLRAEPVRGSVEEMIVPEGWVPAFHPLPRINVDGILAELAAFGDDLAELAASPAGPDAREIRGSRNEISVDEVQSGSYARAIFDRPTTRFFTRAIDRLRVALGGEPRTDPVEVDRSTFVHALVRAHLIDGESTTVFDFADAVESATLVLSTSPALDANPSLWADGDGPTAVWTFLVEPIDDLRFDGPGAYPPQVDAVDAFLYAHGLSPIETED